MKAISFITTSEYTIEAILWAILIGIFAGLTIWNVTDTVNRYQRRETLTRVEAKNMREANYHNPVLCVDYGNNSVSLVTRTERERFLFELNQSSNYLNFLISGSVQFDSAAKNISVRHCEDVDCYISMVESYKKFVSVDKKLSTLVEIAALAVSYLTAMENSLSESIEDLGLSTQIKTIENSTLTYSVLDRLLLENRGKMDQLSYVVGSILCHKMTVLTGYHIDSRFNSRRSFRLESPCTIENQVWLGLTPFEKYNSYLCVNVTLAEMFSFKLAEGKRAHIYLNSTAIYQADDSDIYSREGFFQSYVDFAGERLKNIASLNVLTLLANMTTNAKVEMIGHYKNFHHPDNPKCTKAFAYGDCSGYCIFRNTYRHCECWPSSWNRLIRWENQTKISTCSLETYVAEKKFTPCAQLIASRAEEISQCQQARCKPRCDYTLLHFETSVEPNADGVTFARISPRGFIYHEVEEFLSMDLRAFFSALGGSLSLYIGASFIAIIHVVTYILRNAYQYLYACFILNRLKTKQTAKVAVTIWRSNTQQDETKPPKAIDKQKIVEFVELLKTEECRKELMLLLRDFNTDIQL